MWFRCCCCHRTDVTRRTNGHRSCYRTGAVWCRTSASRLLRRTFRRWHRRGRLGNVIHHCWHRLSIQIGQVFIQWRGELSHPNHSTKFLWIHTRYHLVENVHTQLAAHSLMRRTPPPSAVQSLHNSFDGSPSPLPAAASFALRSVVVDAAVRVENIPSSQERRTYKHTHALTQARSVSVPTTK